MPCYRCGARQTDPEQGKTSPWKRAVRREHQVLICPECLAAAAADLDGCDRCGGTHLIRRLDQVECLDCGLARDADPDPGRDPDRQTGPEPSPKPATAPSSSSLIPAQNAPGVPPAAAAPEAHGSDLADEVSRALERVLHRD